jgi:hypothetical protein
VILIPGLGHVTEDREFGWYVSAPVRVPVLGNLMCSFIVDGYDREEYREAIHGAIRSFLTIDDDVLKQAEPALLEYLEDMNSNWDPGDEEFIALARPSDAWKHVRLGTELHVRPRKKDGKAYISIECGCDWEPEHGLQIVFKEGRVVNKLGPYDGHMTNSDAYAKPELEDVIYRRV